MTSSPAPPLAQEELDLRRYREILLRRKWEVVLIALLVVAGVAVYTATQTRMYRATAEVLLRPSTAEQILAGGGSAAPFNQATTPVNVQTEIQYMKSRSVRNAVRAALGYEPSVTVGTPAEIQNESEVVTLRVTDANPKRAAKAANVYAEQYTQIRKERVSRGFTTAADQVRQQVTELTTQLDQIEAPLTAIDAQIAGAQSIDQLNLLEARRSATEAELRPERDPIVSRLDEAKDRLASFELAVSSNETGGAEIISAAEVPGTPFTPQPLRNGVIAVVLGLMLGAIFAFTREALDDRIRAASSVEQLTGWPVVGALPRQRRKAGDARFVSLGEPGSQVSQAYQMLRTSLQFEGLDRTVRVVMVTSALHGEGKSTTVANLGVTLALDGNRVLLLDCDLRHHRLYEFFDIGNDPGLASVLTGRTGLDDAVIPIDADRLMAVLPPGPGMDGSVIAMDAQRLLSVLPAGPTPPNPSELLASERATEAFRELRERYDYILVDAPPVLPVSDVATLTKHVDGVLFLTNDAVSRPGPIRRAAHLLTQVQAPVIGVVINATPARQRDPYDYYDLGSFYSEPTLGRTGDVSTHDHGGTRLGGARGSGTSKRGRSATDHPRP